MYHDAFRDLLDAPGQRALAQAVASLDAGVDPMAVVTRLRRTYPPALVSAAVAQATLRGRAKAKFGADAAVMYFTSDGLEQATRPEVAAHRARRIRRITGESCRVLDVCCGIGGDLIELARAGCRVDAVDRDPLIADIARANVAAHGLSELVTVRTADAAQTNPTDHDLVFVDPARRGTGGRTFNPMAYSPSWPAVLEMVAAATAACVKAAPGIPYDFLPEDAEVEWISYKGEVKEATIWTGGGVTAGRTATLLPSGATLRSTNAEAETGPIARYLYEPDGAAIRAHLVAEVAEMVHGHLIDPRIAYLTSDHAVATEWATCYEIEEVIPFSGKRLQTALRNRNIGNITIKKRGSAVDIERLRKNLRLSRSSGSASSVVVLTRIGDRPYALLCQPHGRPTSETDNGQRPVPAQ